MSASSLSTLPTRSKGSVLLVTRDDAFAKALERELAAEGFHCVVAQELAARSALLTTVVLADMRTSAAGAVAALEELAHFAVRPAVVLVAGDLEHVGWAVRFCVGVAAGGSETEVLVDAVRRADRDRRVPRLS